MKKKLALAIALALSSLGAAPPEAQQKKKPPCCFNNPGYTGACSVEPGAGETCSSVLAYLNNPNAAGKAYCGNTTLRGGWKAVSCKPAR